MSGEMQLSRWISEQGKSQRGDESVTTKKHTKKVISRIGGSRIKVWCQKKPRNKWPLEIKKWWKNENHYTNHGFSWISQYFKRLIEILFMIFTFLWNFTLLILPVISVNKKLWFFFQYFTQIHKSCTEMYIKYKCYILLQCKLI